MLTKSKNSLSSVIHETVEETIHLPVFFSVPDRGACSGCCCCPKKTFPLHWHEYVEFIFLLRDSMEVVVQCKNYTLQPGDLIIVNSGEFHSTTIRAQSTPYLLMQISAKRLQEIFPNFDLLHFKTCIRANEMQQTPKLHVLLSSLADIFVAAEDGYQLLFIAKLYEMLHFLYQNYCTKDNPQQVDTAVGRDRKRVAEIMDWTRLHFREPLTLEDAAGYLGISKEYFCRVFKKYTGQTYLEFLCSTRTMNFYNQLLTSDLPIPMLMEENGLTNYKTFIRTFKEMYGTTPQKARQEVQL